MVSVLCIEDLLQNASNLLIVSDQDLQEQNRVLSLNKIRLQKKVFHLDRPELKGLS